MVAILLSDRNLVPLRNRLEEMLPETTRIHGLTTAAVNGISDGQEFWVDTWPNFSALVAVTNLEKATTPYDRGRVEIWSCDKEALLAVLQHPNVVYWQIPGLLISGYPAFYLMNVLKILEENGHSYEYHEAQYLRYLPNDVQLPDMELPGDVSMEVLRPETCAMITKVWKYSKGACTERYLNYLQKHCVCFGIYSAGNNTPLAYIMQYDYGAMGMLIVTPEHRRRGFAKALVIQSSKTIRGQGRIPFCFMEQSNAPSIRLHDDLGFLSLAVPMRLVTTPVDQ